MSNVALPADSSTSLAAGGQGRPASLLPAAPGAAGSSSSGLDVTAQQRNYLDALVADRVRPSSDLLALSIGSYVCQARAAGQSSQAVWDFVHPLVSNDVYEANMSSEAPTAADIDETTGTYIRVATERLC